MIARILYFVFFVSLSRLSILFAQSITVSSMVLDEPAVYTFTYVAPQDSGTGTNVPNVFYLWMPVVYPPISPVIAGGSGLQPYITFKVNGVVYPCSMSFGSIGGSWETGIQLSTSAALTGVFIPAGSEIEVIISGLIKNPSNPGTYQFLWRMSSSNGSSIQDFIFPLTFSILTVNDLTYAKRNILLSPNPSSDFVQLSGLSGKESYRLYDNAGKFVREGSISNNSRIDVRELISGVYTLKIGSGEIIKFIKK